MLHFAFILYNPDTFFLFTPLLMIVTSHVKDMIAKAGMRTGGDFPDALAKACEDLCKKAIARAKENKRQTVYACDC